MSSRMNAEAISELRRARGGRWRAWLSAAAIIALVAGSWLGPYIGDSPSGGDRGEKIGRFLAEAVPYPLRSGEADALSGTVAWFGRTAILEGGPAAANTAAMALAALGIAIAIGLVAAPAAARLPGSRLAYAGAARRLFHAAVAASTRAALMFLRAIPEYVWAFLFVSIFGYGALPAVLALALHNGGILGRLYAETFEDAPEAPRAALTAAGSGPFAALSLATLPQTFGRVSLYALYRAETCIRESTVLGMLGIASLGASIRDARAAGFYDDLMMFVALAAALVIAVDFGSVVLRRRLG